jgi:glutamyl-tRNA synthetase
MLDFIDELPEYSTDLYDNKKMKTTKENSRGFLGLCLNYLKDSGDFSNNGVYSGLVETAAANGLKNSQLLWPLRTALSGKQSTPGGASELCELLGKEESLRRIQLGIDLLREV